MERTRWNAPRLERLFGLYNVKYWDGRLPDYRVAAGPLSGAYGECHARKRRIVIDLSKHATDREVRETLLHEMAHAACPKRVSKHGYEFWEQMEMLLRKRAPIRVGLSEMPGHDFPSRAVPYRFRRCRAALRKLSARREREVLKEIPKGVLIHEITDEEIVRTFGDAVADGLGWKSALRAVGAYYGLLDVEGRPANRWAERLIARGRAEHRKWRRLLS